MYRHLIIFYFSVFNINMIIFAVYSYSRPERGELELEDDYRAVGWRKFMGSSISARCVDV